MDNTLNYIAIIKKIIQEHASFKPSYGSIESRVIFDDSHQQYLLVETGWQDKKRINDILIDIEIQQKKICINYDGTDVVIAERLVEAGIPAQDIILGFRHPDVRQYTEFAA